MATLVLSNVSTTINLCESFQKSQLCATQADSPYGLIVDHQAAKTARKYAVYPSVEASDNPTTWSLISLHEILEQKDKHIPLSFRDRLYLAVVISSSLLQLHGTPWVPHVLDSQNMFFLTNSGYPLYSHPIFLNEHENDTKTTPPPPTSDGGVPTIREKDPKLLSLGFLLIELMLGQTLDNLRPGTGPGLFPEGSLMSKYVIAQSVLPRVRTESLNYCTAVTRCIEGDLHDLRVRSDGTGLDSNSLCEDMYSGVVALLEKDYENSC